MEKFLQKIELEIDKKMLACVKGQSIVKPFAKIYSEVREKVMKKPQAQKSDTKKEKVRTAIYSDNEESIYEGVVKQFLEEHPELNKKLNNNDDNKE